MFFPQTDRPKTRCSQKRRMHDFHLPVSQQYDDNTDNDTKHSNTDPYNDTQLPVIIIGRLLSVTCSYRQTHGVRRTQKCQLDV